MALRDQPYLPLYVQDFLTDEKLIECTAKSTGVYIKIMCVMHKSGTYGKILLKQKDEIGANDIENFAFKLTKHLGFSKPVIEESLRELIDEGVLYIKDKTLCQKRMISDNELSIKRAEIGKEGGKKTQLALKIAKAKKEANTEYENEYENEFNIFKKLYPGKKRGNKTEFENLKKKHADWKQIIKFLVPAIQNQIKIRNQIIEKNKWVSEWKNCQTWINQRCWEEELETIEVINNKIITPVDDKGNPR